MAWRKKNITEDSTEDKYFDDEVSGALNHNLSQSHQGGNEEIDPLDAFMQSIEKEMKNESSVPSQKKEKERLIEEDPLESYMDDMKKKLIKEHNKKHNIVTKKVEKKENKEEEDKEDSDYSEDEEINENNQYDFLNSDGEIDFEALRKHKKRKIEPLPSVDHSLINYEPFSKNFYEEHEQIRNLSSETVKKIRDEMEMRAKGECIPNPIISFGYLNFEGPIMNLIIKQGFQKPTPIQCQALPCALSGRDVIGVAKTGSGKTLAYIWPLLVHILDQRELAKNEGPIGVVLCPTRELTQQVYLEARKFAKIYNISIAALLGGESKHEQWKELKAGVEILVATPGRLIEMVKKKATNLKRCTYFVIDEADKMFSMGFEYQIRSIMGQVRSDRQTLLFTATFRKKIQNLALDLLTDPIIINIGRDDQANEDVTQEVVVVSSENQRFLWLASNLPSLLERGKVIIFVNQIKSSLDLAAEIKSTTGVDTLVLHGDKLQQERTQIINQFKSSCNLLIATDVASRGLDVPAIRTVINYECARDGDTHIHRVGRTGRAGNKDGKAITLIMKNDVKFAIILIKNLELSGQAVSGELEEIAMGDDGFKRGKMASKMGLKKSNNSSKLLEKALKRGNHTKAGLGYVDKNDTNELLIKTDLKKQIEVMAESNKAFQKQFIANSESKQETPAPPSITNRSSILDEYSNRFKSTLQMQFRSNFASAGSFQTANTLPTITYVGNPPKTYEAKKDSESFPSRKEKTYAPVIIEEKHGKIINNKRTRWDS